MKRVFLISFCLLICFSGSVLAFSDIGGHWAEEQIKAGAKRGLIAGYPDGTFRPEQLISRAEFVVLLNRIEVEPQTKSRVVFNDVSPQAWYYSDLAKAANYWQGYPDGSFQPEKGVSRQEAAAILTRIFPFGKRIDNFVNSFSDRDQFPDWSEHVLLIMASSGYLNGYPDGTLRPQQALTRAEVITILNRIIPERDCEIGVLWSGTGTELTRIDDTQALNFARLYPWSDIFSCNLAFEGTLLGGTSTDGRSVVCLPKFYYRRTLENDVYQFWVSSRKRPGYELHPAFWRNGKEVPCIYVGTHLEKNAVTHPGWSFLDIQTWSALQLLYLVEYAEADCQKVISDNSYQGLRDLWGNQGQFVHGFEIGTDLQYYLTLNPTSKDYQPMGVYLPAEYQKGKMALLKQAPWFMFTCVPQAPQGIQIEDLAVAVGWEGDLPGSLFTALFADKEAPELAATANRLVYVPN